MNKKESLKILGIAERLGVRSDVTWVKEEVRKLKELANNIDYIICSRCKGRGLIAKK